VLFTEISIVWKMIINGAITDIKRQKVCVLYFRRRYLRARSSGSWKLTRLELCRVEEDVLER